MATVRPQFDVHYSSLRPVSLVSLLISCPLGLASMLWGNVSEGRICIPTLCLKYLVIFIANALLATGWLFVSILSVISELLPSLSDIPPTLVKLPAHQGSRLQGGGIDGKAGGIISMRKTGVEVSYEREAHGEIFTSRTVIQNTQTVKRSDSHRVHFAGGEDQTPVASTSRLPATASAPLTPESITVGLPREPQAGASKPALNGALPSPPSSTGSADPAALPRGRKLTFIRRRFAEKHGRRGSSPSNTILTPPSSAATSPARSPERPESATLHRSSTAPHGAKWKHKGDASSPKHVPVPRTDPYQAPYFFPSPLSPEASGYAGRVRSERTLGFSPEHRSRFSPPAAPPMMLPTPDQSPEQIIHAELALDATVTPAETPEPSPVKENAPTRSKSKGRSWHIPLPHVPRRPLERPASWASEVPTVGSSSGESSHPGSPRRRKLSGLWKRSGNSQLAPLSPLQSIAGIDDVSHTKQKRGWRVFHHRSVSEVHPGSVKAIPDAADTEHLERPRLSRN